MGLPTQRGGSVDDRLLRYAQDSYGILHRSQGQIFYVDNTDGNDDTDNPGTAPWSPVLTITRALALCTAGQSDIIQILQHSPSSPHANEDFPISVNKSGVTIRGCYGIAGTVSDSGFGSDEANEPPLLIAANFVTIEDLYLGIDNGGSTGGVIEFTGNTYGTTIRRCTIELQYAATYGIDATADQPYMLVEDCIFGRISGSNFADVIKIGNGTDMIVRRNLFRGYSGIGINVGLNCLNISILDNKFYLPSDTVGKAITFADGSHHNFIDGNHANFGMTAMTNNPFRDLNNDTSNTWGLNYRAGTSIEPIGT